VQRAADAARRIALGEEERPEPEPSALDATPRALRSEPGRRGKKKKKERAGQRSAPARGPRKRTPAG
jgi:hypothetical protein